MNIVEQLKKEHSKNNSRVIAEAVIQNTDLFNDLKNCFLSNDKLLAQRSAMVLYSLTEKEPTLIQSIVPELVKALSRKDLIDAQCRTIFRCLHFVEIPERFQADLIDHCFAYSANPKSAIAVKAFALQVALNICKLHSDLGTELAAHTELILKNEKAPGVQAKGRNVLKALNRLSEMT